MPLSESENRSDEVLDAEKHSEDTKVEDSSIAKVAPRVDVKENMAPAVRDKMPDDGGTEEVLAQRDKDAKDARAKVAHPKATHADKEDAKVRRGVEKTKREDLDKLDANHVNDEAWTNLSAGAEDDRVAVIREKLGLPVNDSNEFDDETVAAFKRWEQDRGKGAAWGIVTEELFEELKSA